LSEYRTIADQLNGRRSGKPASPVCETSVTSSNLVWIRAAQPAAGATAPRLGTAAPSSPDPTMLECPALKCRPGSAGLLVVSAAVALAVRTCSRWLLIGETFDEGLPVEGRVLATYVLPGDQGRAGLQHAIVGFRAADGRAYRLDTEADLRRPMGARVQLRYLPANPVRAVLVEAGRGTLRTVLTLLFLAGLGLGGPRLTLLCLLCGEWNPATGKRADRREPTFRRIELPCSVVPVPMAGKSEPCPGVEGQLRFPGSWFTQRVMRRSVCPRCRSGYFARSEKWIEAGRVLRPTADPAF